MPRRDLTTVVSGPARRQVDHRTLQRRVHVHYPVRRPLDNHLIAVAERPLADLAAPILRVTVEPDHLVPAEQLVDGGVHLGARDLPAPLGWVPDRRPTVRARARGESPTSMRLGTMRDPVFST